MAVVSRSQLRLLSGHSAPSGAMFVFLTSPALSDRKLRRANAGESKKKRKAAVAEMAFLPCCPQRCLASMKSLLRKLHLIPDEQPEKTKLCAANATCDLTVPNARLSYADHITNLLRKKDVETAMSLVVGGDYERIGEALRTRLVRFGLRPYDYLIDVGCGSGRLASALARSDFRDTLRYLGIDIVPEMLAFAAEKCRQPCWRFELVTELTIPENDGVADMVCFFSVFTHLMQEESFLYLREARRVLKTGGRIVASYLDIAEPMHWETFDANLKSARRRQGKPMDIFLSAAFFETWAAKLDLDLIEERAPDCGQRTCILQKR